MNDMATVYFEVSTAELNAMLAEVKTRGLYPDLVVTLEGKSQSPYEPIELRMAENHASDLLPILQSPAFGDLAVRLRAAIEKAQKQKKR